MQTDYVGRKITADDIVYTKHRLYFGRLTISKVWEVLGKKKDKSQHNLHVHQIEALP